MSTSKAIRKTFPDGNKLKVWLNNAGLSMGIQEEQLDKADPFLSMYSRNSGGYVIVARKELLEKYNIVIEVE